MTDKTLTDVDGIGAKTAKALADAGIDTVAALAAIDTASPPELKGFRGTPAWADWIAAAKALSPAATPAGAPDLPQEAAPIANGKDDTQTIEPTPAVASAVASAAASEEEQAPAPGQPHPAGAPPLADDPYESAVLVVTGPKKGFRRAGFRFDATPRELARADFGEGIEAARRFIALYREPRLNVTLRHPDGSLIEFNEGDISALEIALEDPDTDEGRAILEQFGHLTAAD